MKNLNLKNSALVLIDLQKGIVNSDKFPFSAESVVLNASKIAQKFREKNLPVFLVHVKPGSKDRLNVITDEKPWGGKLPADWAEFDERLNKQQSDIIITKKQWGAFYGTELDLQLRRRKIDTIVLGGISTNYGVESTARFAYEFGYNQIFVEDAMSSSSKEAHEASVNFVLKRIGCVRKTAELIESLDNM